VCSTKTQARVWLTKKSLGYCDFSSGTVIANRFAALVRLNLPGHDKKLLNGRRDDAPY
jgi:hypothetical protein